MANQLPHPTDRRRSNQFTSLRDRLISVAGLIGQDVVNQDDQALGSVIDLVFRWGTKEQYPPLAGVIARVSRRRVWVPAENIKLITAQRVTLLTANIDLREFKARDGEVRLMQEVLDHQLIDVDGARVVRASDLYVAQVNGSLRLVGLEVGLRSLFRRLGPRSIRSKSVPRQVIDWATVQSFGGQSAKSDLKLSASRNELKRLRPGELADMLEDLGRDERQELMDALDTEQVADAIEEMEPEEVETILRESTQKEAGTYLSNMEPDEAADALRDLDEKTRQELLSRMTRESARRVKRVLEYDEELAGGFMNTSIFTAAETETVSDVRKRLKDEDTEPNEYESIAVVNGAGRLVYDMPIIDLFLIGSKTKLEEHVKSSKLVTVPPTASIDEVAKQLIDSRRSSILVVDDKSRPVGRIFADDVIDALLPIQGHFHFPRLLS